MPILKLTDICKDYYQGKEPVRVLKNINLTVERGEYLAIMGPSGSGKTTLMNMIGCLDVPTSGTYELDGQDLKNLSDNDLAEIRNKHLGFVFQRFHLMPKLDALVCGDDIVRSKPDPQIFLCGAQKLGVPIERCAVVEDSPLGAEAGLRAGAKVFLVPGLVRMPEELEMRCVRIGSLWQLPDLIE